MELTIKRNDEFFDVVSHYYVHINDKVYSLKHQENVTIDLPKGTYDIQARYLWLGSRKEQWTFDSKAAQLEVKLFITRKQWYVLLLLIILISLAIIFGTAWIQSLGLWLFRIGILSYIYLISFGRHHFLKIIHCKS